MCRPHVDTSRMKFMDLGFVCSCSHRISRQLLLRQTRATGINRLLS